MTRRIECIHVYVGPDEQVRAEMRTLFAEAHRRIEFVDETTLATILPNVEVLFCGLVPQVDWSKATRLRLLHFMGAGVDHAWPAKGLAPDVIIANARGIHAMEMRDHTLAMLLAFERELPFALEQQRRREWSPFLAGSLAGKTLGLIGIGEVGRPIAKAARALGMHIIGMRNQPLPCPDVDEIVSQDKLPRLLKSADYVVITAPLTSRTRQLIGAPELSCLASHAVLIVVSRGGIVDETALVQALRAGRLRGAALDVFATEPLPATSDLWSTPNIIITPHISGWVPMYVERVVSLFLTNLSRFEQGIDVLTPVQREREY